MATMESNINEIGTDFYVATVRGIDVVNRTCNVFIPKLMMTLPDSEFISHEYPLFTDKIVDAENLKISKSLTKINYFKVFAKDQDEPMPAVNSRVIVYFIDGDPKQGYWTKFNPDGNYEVIDSEKYKKCSSLQIGDKKIDINEEDNIQIFIPNDFKVNVVEKGKNKNIYIEHNMKSNTSIGYLKTFIEGLKKNMDYFVDEKISSANKEIKELIVSHVENVGELLYDKLTNKITNIDFSGNTDIATIEKLKNQTKEEITKYNELLDIYNTYINYITANESKLLDITHLTVNEAKEQVNKYNDILDTDNFEENYNNLIEPISVDKEIKVNVNDNYILSLEGQLGNNISYIYKDDKFTEYFKNNIYEKYVDDNNTNNIGVISYHSSKDISDSNIFSDQKYYKDKTIYGNLIRLDFDIDIAEDENQNSFLIITDDSTILYNTYLKKDNSSKSVSLDIDKYICKYVRLYRDDTNYTEIPQSNFVKNRLDDNTIAINAGTTEKELAGNILYSIDVTSIKKIEAQIEYTIDENNSLTVTNIYTFEN